MKPRLRFRCEARYCCRWATVHVQLRELVMGGRKRTVELCDDHGHRLLGVVAGQPFSVHVRHLVA